MKSCPLFCTCLRLFSPLKKAMLATIKIKEKQYMKLRNVIANKKLPFAIIESRCIEPDNGNNCEVTLNCFSGNPGDLFTLCLLYTSDAADE